jgi:hypothetical protein
MVLMSRRVHRIRRSCLRRTQMARAMLPSRQRHTPAGLMDARDVSRRNRRRIPRRPWRGRLSGSDGDRRDLQRRIAEAACAITHFVATLALGADRSTAQSPKRCTQVLCTPRLTLQPVINHLRLGGPRPMTSLSTRDDGHARADDAVPAGDRMFPTQCSTGFAPSLVVDSDRSPHRAAARIAATGQVAWYVFAPGRIGV